MSFIIANHFYVYCYLRSKSSQAAESGTPYYVGKGKGRRCFKPHLYTHVPKDKLNIIFVAEGLSEKTAQDLEIIHIKFWGRKDINTGILLNRTDGGEGSSGCKPSEATKKKLSMARKGKPGFIPTEATKKKMSMSHKSQIPWNKGKTGIISPIKGKIRVPKKEIDPNKKVYSHRGKPWSMARKEAQISRKGIPWSDARRNAQINKEQSPCS